MNVKKLVTISAFAGLYVAISLAISPLTFGVIQLRIADMLLLFCLYDKKFIYSNALGVLIINLFSPLGIIDVVAGVAVQLVCGYLSYIVKNKWVYSVVCSLIVGFGIGTELYFVFGGIYFLNVGSLILSTIIVLLVGCSLQTVFKRCLRNV